VLPWVEALAVTRKGGDNMALAALLIAIVAFLISLATLFINITVARKVWGAMKGVMPQQQTAWTEKKEGE
jgi:hypothetical protein